MVDQHRRKPVELVDGAREPRELDLGHVESRARAGGADRVAEGAPVELRHVDRIAPHDLPDDRAHRLRRPPIAREVGPERPRARRASRGRAPRAASRCSASGGRYPQTSVISACSARAGAAARAACRFRARRPGTADRGRRGGSSRGEIVRRLRGAIGERPARRASARTVAVGSRCPAELGAPALLRRRDPEGATPRSSPR